MFSSTRDGDRLPGMTTPETTDQKTSNQDGKILLTIWMCRQDPSEGDLCICDTKLVGYRLNFVCNNQIFWEVLL